MKGSIQNLSKKSVQLNLENQDLFKKYREIKKENDEKEFILNEKKRSLEYYFALVEALEK